jgi:hypothetical protein
VSGVSGTTVHKKLRNLTSVHAARDLFAELNYDYADDPTRPEHGPNRPIRHWPKSPGSSLVMATSELFTAGKTRTDCCALTSEP